MRISLAEAAMLESADFIPSSNYRFDSREEKSRYCSNASFQGPLKLGYARLSMFRQLR